MYPYEPIEALGFSGFYEIPGYSRYAISRNGEVITKATGRITTGSRYINYKKPNDSCYYLYTLQGDDKKPKQCRRHRLLCLIFKYPGIMFKDLEVNHINGIKGDDWLDNLEWVTSQENTKHAFDNNLIIRTKVKHPVSVRNVDTGEITQYPDINSCARDNGISVEAVIYRLHVGHTKIFPERKQYRESHIDDTWYIPENIENDLMLNGTNKSILMRNVFTNEIIKFDKLSDLAVHLGLTPSVITRWSNLVGQPVLPGFIQLKFTHDSSPWRNVADPYFELNQTSECKRIVKVTNINSGEFKIYLSAKECAKAHDILPTTLNWRLKSEGKIVYSDGCTYAYYS